MSKKKTDYNKNAYEIATRSRIEMRRLLTAIESYPEHFHYAENISIVFERTFTTFLDAPTEQNLIEFKNLFEEIRPALSELVNNL